jgi:hypothetical protein
LRGPSVGWEHIVEIEGAKEVEKGDWDHMKKRLAHWVNMEAILGHKLPFVLFEKVV